MKQNITQTLILFFFIISGLASCSKPDMVNFHEAAIVDVIDEPTAFKNFSIALSKAVATHEEIREFLKNEALKCFDNDYDVFYPYIKDQAVADLGTFREILVNELGGEQMMAEIERLLPTLTIYVSDITWLDPEGFCAGNWDTSNPQSAVTYTNGKGLCTELYSNGYYLGEIEDGTIPGGAVLIVKSNERVVASVSTKSGEAIYSFVSDVFDASKNLPETKDNRHTGKYTTGWVQGQTPGDNSDVMTATALNSLNPDIITSYNLFNNDPYALQNDYIYYGMTPDSPKGMLRNDVRSKIVRFKIFPQSFKALFDDPYNASTEEGDRNFSDYYETDDNGKGASMEPSVSTIYSKLWSEGSLEINIKICKGSENGTPMVLESFFYDVRARDLFTVKNNSIKREQWGSTAFKWYITWRYSISSRDDNTLVEKWYYPKNTPDLPTWNLVENSAYYIIVSEHDTGIATTKTFSVTTKKANEFTTKLAADATIKAVTVKTEFGWTGNDEKTTTTSTAVSWTNGDDEMTKLIISYADKYIDRKVSASSYVVKSYGSDRFTFTILPYRY